MALWLGSVQALRHINHVRFQVRDLCWEYNPTHIMQINNVYLSFFVAP